MITVPACLITSGVDNFTNIQITIKDGKVTGDTYLNDIRGHIIGIQNNEHILSNDDVYDYYLILKDYSLNEFEWKYDDVTSIFDYRNTILTFDTIDEVMSFLRL